jgi:hypothetical protein
MVRQIIKASSNDIHISVPDNYVGKTLEVLAFTLDETTQDVTEDYINSINALYDNIRVDFTDFVFNRDEANRR